MHNTILATLFGLALTVGNAAAQPPEFEYLDVFKVKVRPDRAMEYENLIKKMADLNRRHNGDRWVAFSTEYGSESGTLYFSSRRDNLAAIETGMAAFEKALKGSLGEAGFGKMMSDLGAMSATFNAEIRRRRWDLSVNAPSSREEQLKTIAAARWIRVIRLELKPARLLDFVDAWKPWQAELAKNDLSVWASVSATGPSIVYLAGYFKSMAEIDAADAKVAKALATDTYRTFTRAVADIVQSSSWEIHRLRPELSCVPDELAALDPTFWKPKPPMAAKPKPAAVKPATP